LNQPVKQYSYFGICEQYDPETRKEAVDVLTERAIKDAETFLSAAKKFV